MVHHSRTRIYPPFTRYSFLVYGLMLSIGIFFIGAFVAYIARYLLGHVQTPLASIPPVFTVSTFCLLLGSHFLWRAVSSIRREKRPLFLRQLTLAYGLATTFCLLQSWGMQVYWQAQSRLPIHEASATVAALVLVFLHIVHFAAGYVVLGYVLIQAYQDRYDHEYYNGVRLAACYWRFLDIIWLLMLGLFWLDRI